MHPAWGHVRLLVEDPAAALEQRIEVARQSGVPPAALERYRESREGDDETGIDAIVEPDRDLLPGVEVETDLGTWQVHETPGHAPSHVVLHQPERKLMISGDHLLGRTVLFFDYGHTPDPVGEFLGGLDEVEPLDVDLCLPGHGRPFRDPEAKIAEARRQVEELLDKVRGSLAEGEQTAFEIVAELVGPENVNRPASAWACRSSSPASTTCAILGEVEPVEGTDPQRWARSVVAFADGQLHVRARDQALRPRSSSSCSPTTGGYADITPLRRVELEREGEPAPNGVGAIRVLSAVGPPLREEVLAYEAPSRFSYKLLSGLPVRDHVGTVELTPQGGGTKDHLRGPHEADGPGRRRRRRRASVKLGVKQLLNGVAAESERRAAAAAEPSGRAEHAESWRRRALGAPPGEVLARAPAGWSLALVAAVLVLVGGVAVVAYELLKRPADVHNPKRRLQAAEADEAKAKTVNWPLYGLDPARTRYLPAKGVKPPFRKLWRYTDRPLLEFPPISSPAGSTSSTTAATPSRSTPIPARSLWKRRIGRLNASSPAYYRHRLYIVNLVPGHIVKLDARPGRSIWKRSLPGRAESSPVVVGRTVYFGCENGELFALSTINGNVRWSTPLGGAIKSAPAYYDGTLYVGDYGGYMNAVDAKTGEARVAERLARAGVRRLRRVLLDPRGRLRPRLLRQQRRPRLQLRPPRRHRRLELLDRRLRLLGAGRRQHQAQPADRLHRLLRRQRLRARRQGRRVRWSRSAGGQVIGSLSAVGDIVYAAEFTARRPAAT